MDPSELEIQLLPLTLSASADAPHAFREIVCRRPYRDGGLRLEAEGQPDGRCVIHCYGHGGSGWTLAPGCGKRILDLALRHFQGAVGESREVTILGGGRAYRRNSPAPDAWRPSQIIRRSNGIGLRNANDGSNQIDNRPVSFVQASVPWLIRTLSVS